MKECSVCCRCYPDQVNHCPGDGQLLKYTLPGDTVLDGRYQLEKRLGQGGMGAVFKARHIFLKTAHAIKIILPDLVGNDPSLTTRFRQEAMAAAAIQHPNTVSVTDYGIIGNTTPFLVMELIEGRSLHDILLVEGKLAPERALDIMLAVSAGVAAAHHHDIVHRDLKPLNVLLKNDLPPSQGVKVLDFGLAKIKSGELLGSFVVAQTQGLMGSPFYMAPEQWGDEEIDRRADIYSLGVILYQMLAGEVPFKGNSVPSIMNKHLTTEPMKLDARGVFVPRELEDVVRHSLAKEMSARPQTIEEFVDELSLALAAVRAGTELSAQSGSSTVQIPPGDTLGGDRDLRTDASLSGGAVIEAPREAELLARADAPPVDVEQDPKRTADPQPTEPTPLDKGSVAAVGDPARVEGGARGAETARQRIEHTAFRDDFDEEVLKTKRGDVPTALLDTAGEARMRAELERHRVADEAAARAEEERLGRESEQATTDSEPRLLVSTSAERVAEEDGSAAQHWGIPQDEVDKKEVPVKPAPRRIPVVPIVAAVLLVMVAGAAVLAYFAIPQIVDFFTRGNSNINTNATLNANAGLNANIAVNANINQNVNPSPTPFIAEVVSFPGGQAQIGRAVVPPVTDSQPRAYLLWVYNQWPAHTAPIAPFEMDRTEVTKAEYATFVADTGHPAPLGWSNGVLKAGQERLPVSGVTFNDAVKFAAWRSQRDGRKYRLPTEAEWEYAANGGDTKRIYPWGSDWTSDRANLNADKARPVGSYPSGRSTEGLDDMIGNVWEWTSSTAAMYKGNDRTALVPADKGKIVVRGGSYKSAHDGIEPITVTSRRWVAKDTRDAVLGFRLVRDSR